VTERNALAGAVALACGLLGLWPGPAAAGDIAGAVALAQPDDADSVVVYVSEVAGEFQVPIEPVHISQKDARFTPAVLPLIKGSRVDFTNDDRVTHSVFSKSDLQPFDLGLYSAGDAKLVQFERLGAVEIFCSIHPRMLGVVLVLQNPFFTHPAESGKFSLRNVPAGSYELVAYRLGGQVQKTKVKVPAKGTVSARFALPKPAPAAQGAERQPSGGAAR
jgi:plastocyanin